MRCGLEALWAGFGAAEVQSYAARPTATRARPRRPIGRPSRRCDKIENQYPAASGRQLDGLRPDGHHAGRPAAHHRGTNEGSSAPDTARPRRASGSGWASCWRLAPLGDAELADGHPARPAAGEPDHPPIPVRFTLPEAGLVTLVIEDATGKRVRNLVGETPFPAGDNVAWWDGMDDLGRDAEAARHGVYHIPAQLVRAGRPIACAAWCTKAIELRYEFSVYNAGSPAWTTADHTGGWLTNHTPPSSALFVPGERAPGGKPLVYLGSYVSEGRPRPGLGGSRAAASWAAWAGSAATGPAPRTWPATPAPRPWPTHFAYVGAAWEGGTPPDGADRQGRQAGRQVRLPRARRRSGLDRDWRSTTACWRAACPG